MDLDGFHVTKAAGHVGRGVSASAIEHATPVTARQRAAWKYHDRVPQVAEIDRYFYGYEDLEELTSWNHADIKRKYLSHKWRWRLDNTTKERQFYVYDLLVTVWSYMQEWPGNLDSNLLIEAEDYRASV